MAAILPTEGTVIPLPTAQVNSRRRVRVSERSPDRDHLVTRRRGA
jgi:hypothetical protein